MGKHQSSCRLGLNGILKSGYVWGVELKGSGAYEAWVESDHTVKNLYRTALVWCDGGLASHSCACTS
jgi:hypothetical protein